MLYFHPGRFAYNGVLAPTGGRLSQDQCFCMPQAQTCTTASPSPSTTSSSPPSSDSPTSSYDQSFNGED